MKKKFWMLGLALIASLSLAACGNNMGKTTMDQGRDTNGREGEPTPTHSESMRQDADSAANRAGNAVDSATQGAGNVVNDAAEGVGNAAKDVVDGAEKVVQDATNGVTGAVDQATGR